jgi:hypothetical protein
MKFSSDSLTVSTNGFVRWPFQLHSCPNHSFFWTIHNPSPNRLSNIIGKLIFPVTIWTIVYWKNRHHSWTLQKIFVWTLSSRSVAPWLVLLYRLFTPRCAGLELSLLKLLIPLDQPVCYYPTKGQGKLFQLAVVINACFHTCTQIVKSQSAFNTVTGLDRSLFYWQ